MFDKPQKFFDGMQRMGQVRGSQIILSISLLSFEQFVFISTGCACFGDLSSVVQSKSTSETTRQQPFQLNNVKLLIGPKPSYLKLSVVWPAKGQYFQDIENEQQQPRVR